MIREFFLDEKVGIPFHLFGIVHISCILALIIMLILVYKYRNKIKNIKNKNKVRIIMFIILFSNMLIYYGSYIYYGVYDIKVHLPLHFCFIAGNLFMIYLLTKNRKLYKVVYFLTFIGPLPAIIFPDLVSSFDYFVFYQYFISHHLLMVFSYFILYMDNFYIDIKDVFKAFVWANIIFITMMIFNQIFGTNYIMSKELPEHIYKLFPILKKISPIPILEITGIIVVMIIYILVYIKNKEDRNGK